jgi:hypothetical protein
LNEQSVGSHIEHLRARKAPLIARGITAEGYAHLEEYCHHLDTLMVVPKPTEETEEKESIESESSKGETLSPIDAIRRTIRGEKDTGEARLTQKEEQGLREIVVRSHHLLRNEVREIAEHQGENTRLLSDRFEKMQEKIRLLTYLAAAGAGSGVLSFLTLLLFLIIR